MNKNLLVSFSGGKTSAFMAQWIKNCYEDNYDSVIYVFANTGLESPETLDFVYECDRHFKLGVYWVEANVSPENGIGTSYRQVDEVMASRNGKPFRDVVSKYGIPNQKWPHCTRELKQQPISAFARDYFEGQKWDTAIGIRADEADRINPKAKELGYIYPLISKSMIPTTKHEVDWYWKQMPFTLNIKDYQGNCRTCWKKSDAKLFRIANENPDDFKPFMEMERDFGYLRGEKSVFFRNNRSALDILQQAKLNSMQTTLDLVGGDSCEVFSECGQ